MYQEDFIKELKSRVPIESIIGSYLPLKRAGNKYVACCPFHKEKTPSFTVYSENASYYCFGCGVGGDVIDFVRRHDNLSYQDAVRLLATKAGLALPKEEQTKKQSNERTRLTNLCRDAARHYQENLYSDKGIKAMAYAEKRGLTKDILDRFGIGFALDSFTDLTVAMKRKGYTDRELQKAGLTAESNGKIYDRFRGRLMFPIRNVLGNNIGFGGRIIDLYDDGKPKYMNSPATEIFDKRNHLFALDLARESRAETLILVEGYLDAIMLHQHGFNNAIASLGTALTEEHAKLLSRYTKRIILIYDGDEAGQKATFRAIPILEKAGLCVRILRLREAKDPDEFLKKFGAEKWKNLIRQAPGRVGYQLDLLTGKYDLTEDEQRIDFVREAAELLGALESAAQREIYGIRVAKEANISFEAVKAEIRQAIHRRTQQTT